MQSIDDLAETHTPFTPAADDLSDVARAQRNASIAAATILAGPHDRNEDNVLVEDLLADLMHLCDFTGLDFDEVLDTARSRYIEEQVVVVSLRIENTYEDGDEVITTPTDVAVPAPPHAGDEDAYNDWANDYIMELCGTGRTKGDSWYDVEVTATSAPELLAVGTTFEFGY